MSKWLLVGDPHVTENELGDCENLLKGVLQTVESEKPDFVCFFGDLHDAHKLINVFVLDFWLRWFSVLSQRSQIVALVGNHDLPGDGSILANALMAYRSLVMVVDRPTVIKNVLLTPYIASTDEFKKTVLEHPQKIVLNHQEFNGAAYEGGFYAKRGVNQSDLPDRYFLCGHIHKPQKMGRVEYIGAPRWRTVADANTERAICLVELGCSQPILLNSFPTDAWCRPIVRVVDDQKAPLNIEMKPGVSYVVDIHGDQRYIDEKSKKWVGARVRTFKVGDNKSTQVALESLGITKALDLFLENYISRNGTPKETLKKMLVDRAVV